MTQATKTLADQVRQGDRRALAKAITLAESTRDDHRQQTAELLETLIPDSGNSFRIGISGAPGVGKSTFIEVLGSHLIKLGHSVAVLAVDPSSAVTGGSILGDKTRMETLAFAEKAFVRPSPAGSTLGGVARRTRESMLLCEAAGFDIILVETVGVGQSETTVADMTDMFLLLLLPAGGDILLTPHLCLRRDDVDGLRKRPRWSLRLPRTRHHHILHPRRLHAPQRRLA